MIEIRHTGMSSSDDTKRAYDQIYSSDGILLRDSMYLWLISLLGARPGASLLDISCGEGQLVKLAQERGLRATGMDFSEQGVRRGTGRTGRCNFAVGDGERMPVANDSVDHVTHIGSLEHYHNPPQGAAEIARVLRPGGTAVVLLPNTFGVLHLGYVARHGDVFDDGQPVQRYASRRAWERMLEAGGLRVTRVTGTAGYVPPRTWRDAAWLARRPAKIARVVLGLLTPANLSNNIVYVCTKAAP
jgi:demethylmenaquinone methyltransferase/2-methoxy-6-polyprenyl-1,4-benzoquinol methylase